MARHNRDQRVGHAVLTLDRSMSDPVLAAVLARDAGKTPQWLRDQRAAAKEHALSITEAGYRSGLFVSRREGPIADIPDWARLGAFTTLVEWIMGRGSTCLHSPHPNRPLPVFAAAWRPSLTACPMCTHLFVLKRGSDRDRTCDACGRIVTGEDGDLIRPTAIHLGVMTYSVGTCTDCRWTPL